MTTDRQKICKCGANVAEFLSDIRILEMNLKIAKVENSSKKRKKKNYTNYQWMHY